MSNIKINEVVLSHSPAPDLCICVEEWKPGKWSERYTSQYIAWPEGHPEFAAYGDGIDEAVGNLIFELMNNSDYAGLSMKKATYPGTLGEFTMYADRYERVNAELDEWEDY